MVRSKDLSLLLLLALSCSCGGDYNVKVTPLTINPIEINVKAELTITDIMAGFKIQCRRDLGPSATNQEVSDCASLKFATLISDISEALN